MHDSYTIKENRVRETTGSTEAVGTPSWRRIALLALLALALVIIIGVVLTVVS